MEKINKIFTLIRVSLTTGTGVALVRVLRARLLLVDFGFEQPPVQHFIM
jgi:hypothetical protein